MKLKVKEKPLRWIAIWIPIGASIGIPIENLPIGVGLGTGIGFFLFFISYRRNKK
jgi:hypothetical protein